MIEKADIVRRIKDVMSSDEFTMPLYLGHLLQTLPWYGLPPDLEIKARMALAKLKNETQRERDAVESIYNALQKDEWGE